MKPKHPPHWRTYSSIKPRNDNYLPFRLAARAADVPEKQIRHWIDRQLVNFDADAERGEVIEHGVFKGHVPHRRFSELDVIRIALIERFSEFGFETEQASNGAERVFQNICKEWNLRYYPPELRDTTKIIDGLTATCVFIHMGQRVPVLQPRGGKETVRMERTKDIMVVDVEKMKKINPAAEGALLILFTAEIVRDVYKRLNEIQGED